MRFQTPMLIFHFAVRLASLMLFLVVAPAAFAALSVPHLATDVPTAHDYTVTLSQRGRSVKLPLQDLLRPPQTEKDNRDVNQRRPLLGIFEFSGQARVRVAMPLGQSLPAVTIRPLAKKIVLQRGTSAFSFLLSAPCNLSLEIGGTARPIFLFANPLYSLPGSSARVVGAKAAQTSDLSLRGSHDQTLIIAPGASLTGDINLDDTQDATVFLGLGSVVRGKIFANRAKNVRVYGSGVLWNEGASTGNRLWSHTSDGFLLEGPTFVQNEDNWTTYFSNTNRVSIKNLKVLSAIRDGIDLNGCQHALVKDAFVYAFDDGIAVMSNNWSGIYDRPVRDIRVQNCTLWNSGGGNPMIVYPAWTKASVIEDITFENIDVIHKENDSNKDLPTGAIGGFSYDNTEGQVRDLTFKEIRIEDFEAKTPSDYLVDLVIWPPNVSYLNWRLENVTYLGEKLPPSIIRTGDAPATIDGVKLINFRHQGQILSTAQDAKLEYWGNVWNLTLSEGKKAVVLNPREPNAARVVYRAVFGTGPSLKANGWSYYANDAGEDLSDVAAWGEAPGATPDLSALAAQPAPEGKNWQGFVWLAHGDHYLIFSRENVFSQPLARLQWYQTLPNTQDETRVAVEITPESGEPHWFVSDQTFHTAKEQTTMTPDKVTPQTFAWADAKWRPLDFVPSKKLAKAPGELTTLPAGRITAVGLFGIKTGTPTFDSFSVETQP